MTLNVVPTDSRYIPFVQQPYCCAPACIQMVLYKNGLDLLPQEQIGAELGLTVPMKLKETFYNINARDKPAVASGFGTQVQNPEFGLDKLIKKYNWPFRFTAELASKFLDESSFISKLKDLVAADTDVLICFQNDHGTGHVCVVDIVDRVNVRIMDPSQEYPKWRLLSHSEIYERVKAHGDDNYGGLWLLEKI